MSIAVCTLCTRYVDTDFDTDGVWLDTDFLCAICAERQENATGNVFPEKGNLFPASQNATQTQGERL